MLQFYRSKNWEVTMKYRTIKHQKLTTLLLMIMSLSALSLAGCGSDAGQPAADAPAASVPAEAQAPEPVSETMTSESAADSQPAPAYPLPIAAEAAGIYVKPIPELADGFIRGMDVSSILAEEKKRREILQRRRCRARCIYHHGTSRRQLCPYPRLERSL